VPDSLEHQGVDGWRHIGFSIRSEFSSQPCSFLLCDLGVIPSPLCIRISSVRRDAGPDLLSGWRDKCLRAPSKKAWVCDWCPLAPAGSSDYQWPEA
jgi:hypothetical protein